MSDASMSTSSNHVAILGCGVIGLSTALAILEGQLDHSQARKTFVTIVSKEVPDLSESGQQASGQKHSAEYASVWAVSIGKATQEGDDEMRWC